MKKKIEKEQLELCKSCVFQLLCESADLHHCEGEHYSRKSQ
ncbi:hypothetical protein ACQUWN_23110 [Rossellomorea aquimaris]|nr:hypothetical protein [Rossellomorea vietnamensis]